VAASLVVLLIAVVFLVASGARLGWGDTLAIGLPTLLVVVPAVLLYERLVYQRERLVITTDSVEKRRGGKVLDRLDRRSGVQALRFRLSAAGQPWGLEKLLLHDGTHHLRLHSDRWSSQHAAILDAIGVDATPVDHQAAQREVPGAFPLWERRPNLVAGLVVLGLIVLVLVLPFGLLLVP
jgi:hypothetical protein